MTSEEDSFLMREFKVIKAVVLCIVVVILLVSACKFVFKMFSRYSEGERRDDNDF